jgi:NAD(P)H-hydrate epimerase
LANLKFNLEEAAVNAVSVAEMRELDRRTIEEYGVPGEVLMQRAGLGVAMEVAPLAEACGGEPLVQIFAGKGNNGGDAFVAAYCLLEMGCDVELFFAGDSSAVSGDALVHLKKMLEAGIELRELATVKEWQALAGMPHLAGDILLDGLLGTGISGAPRGVVAAAIEAINVFSRKAPVVAIDIPSGLNGDSGVAEGAVVCADCTVTMAMPKNGLLQPAALDFVGSLSVVDIGIPAEYTDRMAADVELITPPEVSALFERRRRSSHKGCYGHVLLIGGASGYAGAIAMAGMAALRSGVGLVSLLVPESIATVVAGLLPEAMVHAGLCNDSGSLCADALEPMANKLRGFSAIAIGPGMTQHPAGAEVLKQALALLDKPVVLDADALNLLAKIDDLPAVSCRPILTPHPGEMARLLGGDAAAIQADRFDAARRAAEKYGAVVVLKGAGTVVTAPGQSRYVNMSGNPGMAVGGSGDVLTGLMAGLAAQGLEPLAAAKAAVHIHGVAGDAVALAGSQASMTATDIVDAMPKIFRRVTGR